MTGSSPFDKVGPWGDHRRINQVASRQYGAFNTRQAREAGFDKFAVRRRALSGAWIELDANVYSVASAPPKWERQQAALVLSRPRAVVVGRAAAYLHGLRGFGATRPTILVPASSNTRSRLGRVIRAQLFDEIATVEVAGFEVTTVAETLLHLARDLESIRLEDVFDDALLSRRLKLKVFDPILQREEGRRTRGFNLVKALVEDRRPSAPSVGATYLEAMLERTLKSAMLPGRLREHPFTIGGVPARVDVFVPDWRLVIEADGRSWHMRMSDFEKDRRRDSWQPWAFRSFGSPIGCSETIPRAASPTSLPSDVLGVHRVAISATCCDSKPQQTPHPTRSGISPSAGLRPP